MVVEGGATVDGIDGGDDAVEPVLADQPGLGHQGVQDRRRIGQAGGFDHHAVELAPALPGIAPGRIAQRAGEVAADGAAQAAALQCHHLGLVGGAEQAVIEPDLAELVDDHQGAVHVGLADQTIEQGGLAAAEKAGQQGDGDRGRLSLGHGRRTRKGVNVVEGKLSVGNR